MRPVIKAGLWSVITITVGLLGLFGQLLIDNIWSLSFIVVILTVSSFYIRYREEKEVENVYGVMDNLIRDNLEFGKSFILQSDSQSRCQIMAPDSNVLRTKYGCREMRYDGDITLKFDKSEPWAGEVFESNIQKCYNLSEARANPGEHDISKEKLRRTPSKYDAVIATPIRSARDQQRVIGVFNFFCEAEEISQEAKRRCMYFSRLLSAILSSKKAAKGHKSW